jgi:26S proteasome non-ATPase regulatory subunit 10
MIAVSLKEGDELVDLFLRKGADVNAKSKSSLQPRNPLFSSFSRFRSLVLSSSIASNLTPLDTSSQTALHFTASKLNLPAAKKLLSANPPASTRVKDIRGQYPIHRAAAIGSVPLVQLFLANKSPLDATDVSGQTPLHHAIAEGHGDTAVALLKAGAATDKKDNEGFLALDLAPDSQVGGRGCEMWEVANVDVG